MCGLDISVEFGHDETVTGFNCSILCQQKSEDDKVEDLTGRTLILIPYSRIIPDEFIIEYSP